MKCREGERININFYDIFDLPTAARLYNSPETKNLHFIFQKNLLKPLNGHDSDAVIAGLR